MNEELVFIYLILLLISLFIMFFYPYVLARYLVTKDINKIWVIAINGVFAAYLFLGFAYWSTVNSSYSQYNQILRFLRIFYVLIPFCYYHYFVKFKHNQPRSLLYIMICLLNLIIFFDIIY